MKLNTKYHGVREYEEKDIITFNKGLPGFENLKKFIVFPLEENQIFNVLHSTEDLSIGIVVISPFDFISKYELNLKDEAIKRLKIKDEKDVMVLNTITVNSNQKNITTNLRAPIVINIKEKLGEQIILENEEYVIKYPLFRKGDAQC